MKALLAKAEGVLKLLWSWIRGEMAESYAFPSPSSLCLHSPDTQKDCFSAWGATKTEAGAATGT